MDKNMDFISIQIGIGNLATLKIKMIPNALKDEMNISMDYFRYPS